MSGSPVLQNGKLFGAVTHVFVQDSTGGYGIFIENMIGNGIICSEERGTKKYCKTAGKVPLFYMGKKAGSVMEKYLHFGEFCDIKEKKCRKISYERGKSNNFYLDFGIGFPL